MNVKSSELREMKKIAVFINRAIENSENESELITIKNEIKEFCFAFPLYPELSK